MFLRFRRHVSLSITIASVDKRLGSTNKFRVPLLKSPSHLGHSTQRVQRKYNEDRLNAGVLDIDGRTVFNFNIFDGHGGDQCSSYLTAHLSENIEKYDQSSGESLLKSYAKEVGGYWKRYYKSRESHFQNLAESGLTSLSNVNVPELKSRLTFSFLETDLAFMKQEDNKSGSTCTSALITTLSNDDKYYFDDDTVNLITIAHVGDTKAIIVDKNGLAHAITQPHHPSNPLEAARLRKYATNFMTDSFGEERFVSLANTRAFGDLNFKEQGVSSEPEIIQIVSGDSNAIKKSLTSEEISKFTVGGLGGDESFLILCSDGVTGILTDQEIADIVMTTYNNKGHGTPQQGADEVLKFVEYVGGSDNSTVLIIRLTGWGKWPLEDRTGKLRLDRVDDYNPRRRT